MKKILVFLSMSFMLSNISNVSKLWAEEALPIFVGNISTTVYRVVEVTDGYVVIEVEGKKYCIKVQ